MGWAIAAILAIIILFIMYFNQIVREGNQVNNSFSTVDVFLKKRYDLIPNLVEVVKGHATQEREVFENIAGVRAKAMSANAGDDAVKMDGELNTALKSLFAVAENYPNLKTNASYLELQKNLLAIEEELAAARRTYNAAVTEYNITIESFPTNLVAKMMSRKAKVLFTAEDEIRNVIHVNL